LFHITDSILLAVGYAFDVLHLHRAALLALAYNQRAIRAYEKAGFTQEGIERAGAWIVR
jgi:RimJ/RimL family protein N-acetyltransferase